MPWGVSPISLIRVILIIGLVKGGQMVRAERGGSQHLTPRNESILTAICGLCGLLSVGSLLAWAFGMGRFDLWFLALGIPAMSALLVIGIWSGRSRSLDRLRKVLTVGVAGGLLGTIGYDVFRLPFVAFGLRLFAPIESYGVLLLGSDSSSAWTHLAGWAYHFSNGIGFGIFYACAAYGRKWWWGVAWAMVLETATIATPFAATYSIQGKWDLIAIAYAAHVAYGVPLGKVVERGEALSSSILQSPHALRWMLGGLAAALLLWHRPWTPPAAWRTGDVLAAGPSAVVRGGKFFPDWLRVAPGGCAAVRNDDRSNYRIDAAVGRPVLVPGKVHQICFANPGVHRVITSKAPYSGGFVIVDSALTT